MRTGLGRLILRDGTDLPFSYNMANGEFGGICNGSLKGDIWSIDPREFAVRMNFHTEDGLRIGLLVTHHSDRPLTFIGQVEPQP